MREKLAGRMITSSSLRILVTTSWAATCTSIDGKMLGNQVLRKGSPVHSKPLDRMAGHTVLSRMLRPSSDWASSRSRDSISPMMANLEAQYSV
uniref:Putative secreted protein n=1 Tax=Ixodes ricinus TaxID=34613 RepID=A0A6B0UBT9_IXORI